MGCFGSLHSPNSPPRQGRLLKVGVAVLRIYTVVPSHLLTIKYYGSKTSNLPG